MPIKSVGERLARIETEIINIKEALHNLSNNHLTSIYTRLNGLDKKFNSRLPIWGTIMISLLSSLCASLIVYGIYRP